MLTRRRINGQKMMLDVCSKVHCMSWCKAHLTITRPTGMLYSKETAAYDQCALSVHGMARESA